jgi:hypothetical protein
MKKTILILIAVLAPLTIEITSQAQVSSTLAIKITKNQWSWNRGLFHPGHNCRQPSPP